LSAEFGAGVDPSGKLGGAGGDNGGGQVEGGLGSDRAAVVNRAVDLARGNSLRTRGR
jgi:hypothetical protein